MKVPMGAARKRKHPFINYDTPVPDADDGAKSHAASPTARLWTSWR